MKISFALVGFFLQLAVASTHPAEKVYIGHELYLTTFKDMSVTCHITTQNSKAGGISCSKTGKFKNISAIPTAEFNFSDHSTVVRTAVGGHLCYAYAQYSKPGGLFCFNE